MKKTTEWFYNSVSWFVLGLSILAFYFFHFLEMPDAEFAFGVRDWLHLVFTTWLGVVAVNTFRDKGTRDGLKTNAFKLADETNNEVNKKYNSNIDEMRIFIDRLNEHERVITYENFFEKIRFERRLNSDVALTVNDLTKKELRRYNRLKPIYYTLEGFNLPILHEITRDKRVKYDVSYDVEGNKKFAMIKKALTGLMLGLVTVNVMWSADDGYGALVKLAIVMSGLGITSFFNWAKPLHDLSEVIPKKVLNKVAVYESFENWKKGNLILKKEVAPIKVEETVKEEYIKPTIEKVKKEQAFDLILT